MEDRDRLPSLVAGEPAAWEAFVRAHAALLHAAVARVLGPHGGASGVEPDDVVQAVFKKLWEDGRRRLAGFQGRSRLSTWLVAIAQRTALDRVRAPAAGPRVSFDAAAPADGVARNGRAAGSTVFDGAAARDENRALDAALATLSPRDRLLVPWVHLDGRSYGEVARLLAVPENSISPWLARARARLGGLLDRRTDPSREPL